MRILRLPEGWLTVVTLAVALTCAVASVVEAKWVDHLDILYPLVLFGLLAGLAMTRLRVSSLVIHLGSTLIGAAVVAVMTAGTITRGASTLDKLEVLWTRIVVWLRVVNEGGFGTEPVLFLLLLATAGWAAGYWSSWWVFRRHSAVFPLAAAGAMLVINVSYAVETVTYLLPFAVASLILVTRLNFYRQEAAWVREGLRYSRGILRATLPLGIAMGVVAATFGWYAPEIPPSDDLNQFSYELRRPVQDFQWQFNRLFGGIRGRGGIVWAASVSGFGNSMSLSGQFRLADYEVLRVWSTQGRYWRAVVFDRYNGQGWTMNQPVTSTRLGASEARPFVEYQLRTEMTQVVEVVQSRGDYLIASSEPLKVDIPVTAETIGRPRQQVSEETRTTLEPLALRASMNPGRKYQVLSSVSVADAASLRKAGTEYPADLRVRYTRLPTIPQRVRDLAAELTAKVDNPYDQAKAIETYLRTLPYSLDIAPPPPDRDGVDYFLFDVKAGYCDYYASAMAVMARSQGIPARVVSGYATGTRETVDDPFVVRDSNAHSWVEIFFPNYGWVEFEPSSYRPVIEHLGVNNSAPVDSVDLTDVLGLGDDFPPFEPEYDFASMSPFRAIFEPEDGTGVLRVGGVLIAIVAVLAAIAYGVWMLSLRGLTPVPATYARVVYLASLLGSRPKPTETPREFVARLSGRASEIQPALTEVAASFTDFRWGKSKDDSGDRSRLFGLWKAIRRGLVAAVPERIRRRARS